MLCTCCSVVSECMPQSLTEVLYTARIVLYPNLLDEGGQFVNCGIVCDYVLHTVRKISILWCSIRPLLWHFTASGSLLS